MNPSLTNESEEAESELNQFADSELEKEESNLNKFADSESTTNGSQPLENSAPQNGYSNEQN